MTADDDPWLDRIRAEGSDAVAALFEVHRERLKRTVRLRMDRRAAAKIDPSDVVQIAVEEAVRRAGEYTANPNLPPFVWARYLVVQALLGQHRRIFGTRMRDASREVEPAASSESLADCLIGREQGPADHAARAELRARLELLLDTLPEIHREVLILRHFEELTNKEAAAVLGLKKTAASNRYVHALAAMRKVLDTMPGFLGEVSE